VVQPTILKYSNTAYKRVLGINRLIDDLTEHSHLEVGQIPFDFRLVSARELVEDLTKSFKHEVELAGLSFEVVSEEEAKRTLLLVDIDRMKQVCDNLLWISMKHTPPGGEIRVTLVNGEDRFFVTVSDTGTGIAEEDLSHIFERFFQGNHDQAGMGLGLSIVKEIVTQHRGRITVTRLEKGTAFIIQLPVSDETKAS
jgi:signal transduction histidine kinase